MAEIRSRRREHFVLSTRLCSFVIWQPGTWLSAVFPTEDFLWLWLPLDFFLGDRLLIRFPLDCRCRSSSSEDDEEPELDDPDDPEELDEELRVGIFAVLRASQRQVWTIFL